MSTNELLMEVAEKWQMLLIERSGMEARHQSEREALQKEEAKLEGKLMMLATVDRTKRKAQP